MQETRNQELNSQKRDTLNANLEALFLPWGYTVDLEREYQTQVKTSTASFVSLEPCSP